MLSAGQGKRSGVIVEHERAGEAQDVLLARWPLWVLRAISVFYLYGALVHVANLAGWRPMLDGVDIPAHWVVADVVYLVLDLAVVLGVWLRKRLAVAAFVVAALSQVAIYTVFPDAWAIEPEHYAAIRTLVVFHVVSLVLYGAAVWLSRRKRAATTG